MSNSEYHMIQVRDCVLGDGIPKICVPIVATSLETLREELDKTEGVPFDLVELRADYYMHPDFHYENAQDIDLMWTVLSQVRDCVGSVPVLFTIRTAAEGGQARLSFDEYAQWNLWAADTGLVDLIDIELFTADNKAAGLASDLRKKGVKTIGSSHDFEKTPQEKDMLTRMLAMQRAGFDISKLAVMPQKDSDVSRLISLSVSMKEQYADRPFITMSMGKTGAVTRAIGAFTGSAVTFATAGNSSAPGQMKAADLKKVLSILG